MSVLVIYITLFGYFYCVEGSYKLDELPGHLQRLAAKTPNLEADAVDGFPDQKSFFDNYVSKSKPLIMRGAVKDTFARNHWTDDYFLSLSIPADETVKVAVQARTKQALKMDPLDQHFHDFVKQYNSTDVYLVNSLPLILGKDIVLPKPLHCEEIYNDKIVDSVLWYSSGNTRSILHTDSIENINCVYHGVKEFVLIDPHKYFDKVDLDFPVGAYSAVDVDSVDYEKYPGLAEVEFIVANVSAGDCIYLPYKWFHHVRSFSRNIAVSVWWENQDVYAPDFSKCSDDQYNHSLTLDRINYQYTTNEVNTPNVKDFFRTLTKKGSIPVEAYAEKVLAEMTLFKYDNHYVELFKKITDTVDQNSDGMISRAEIDSLPKKDWLYILEVVYDLELLLVDIELRMKEDKLEKEGEFEDVVESNIGSAHEEF